MAKPVKKTKKTTAPKMITGVELENQLFSLFDKAVNDTENTISELNKIIDKTKAQLKKAGDKKKKAKDKRVVLAAKIKVKPTAAAENQLEKAKAAYDIASQEVEPLQAALKERQAQLKAANHFQKKLAMLSKTIETFDKAQKKKKKTKKKDNATNRKQDKSGNERVRDLRRKRKH